MYTNNTFFIILTLHNKGEEQFAIISILEDYEARHIACLQKFRKEFIHVGGKCEQHTSNLCEESTDQQWHSLTGKTSQQKLHVTLF